MNRLAIAVSVAILDNVSGLRPVAQAVSLQRASHLVQLGTAELKKGRTKRENFFQFRMSPETLVARLRDTLQKLKSINKIY